MKKILYLVTKSNWGGAQRYVYDLAVSLPNKEFEVRVAFGEGGVLEKKLQGKQIPTILIEGLRRDVHILKEISVFSSLIKLLKKERPDIIHLNSSKMGGLGSIAGRLCGVSKIVFTVHGWAFNENRNIISKAFIWLLSWLTGLFSTDIIAVSERDYRQAIKMPFLQKKTVHIKNGIDTNIQFLTKEQAKARLFSKIENANQLEKNTFVIGTIAELTGNKGLTHALDAIAKLNKNGVRNFIYIIIGEGEDRKRLERRIRGLGLTGKVFLVGFIENAINLLRAFDIFLLPSIKEGLPYTLLEAGLAGLPVVSTNVGGSPEIIKDGATGISVPPKNDVAIAQALEKIILKKTKADYGTALKEKVEREFTLQNMVSETSDVYKS